MFVGEIRKFTNQGVATIGGKGHQPSEIGTVRWILRNDPGKLHEYLVEDALFLPRSHINILSVTFFAWQLNDLTGTGIDTKQLKYCFYWYSSKYSLTIHRPPSNIPEISIHEGFALSTMFRTLVSRVFNTSNCSKYGCCYTKMDDNYNDDPHTHKHDEHSTRCGCQSVFASSQDDITSELFDIRGTFFFTNDGWSGLVKVKSFSLDEKMCSLS